MVVWSKFGAENEHGLHPEARPWVLAGQSEHPFQLSNLILDVYIDVVVDLLGWFGALHGCLLQFCPLTNERNIGYC